MDTPLDRVVCRLRMELSILQEGSERHAELAGAIYDVQSRCPRPSTLGVLFERWKRWHEFSLNATSEALAAEAVEEGMMANHWSLFQHIADDFDAVLEWLRGAAEIQVAEEQLEEVFVASA